MYRDVTGVGSKTFAVDRTNNGEAAVFGGDISLLGSRPGFLVPRSHLLRHWQSRESLCWTHLDPLCVGPRPIGKMRLTIWADPLKYLGARRCIGEHKKNNYGIFHPLSINFY